MSSHFAENIRTAIQCIEVTAGEGADVALLPELMVTGCGPHLHHAFAQEGWYGDVREGLVEILKHVRKHNVSALVGSPYLVDGFYVNAVVLIDPIAGIRCAGGRMLIARGWTKKWNFAGAKSKDPIEIDGILCGFVICNEAGMLDQLEDSGLERSQIILWPAVTVDHLSEEGEVIRDSCGDGVKAISLRYGCPVIQASYINETSTLPPTRRLGGIAVASEDGSVVHQAPVGREAHIVCEVTLEKVKGTMSPRLSLTV